jgi:peptidoglycan/xylan/chitin deacetylase (PgdA/CDA1 family)
LPTKVYITVDTESSMGGAWGSPDLRPVPAERRIFCRINGTDCGIGWQCDELSRRGLRATFFCEVLSALVLGDRDTRSYLDLLLQRGQDVQLHAHPNFYYYSEYQKARSERQPFDHSLRSDSLGSLPEATQRHLLEQAGDLFFRFTGRRPVAYRAGSYQASSRTLAILAEQGFVLDSSFNPCFQGRGSFDRETLRPNTPQMIEGIWEIPVTVAVQNLPDPRVPSRLRPCEVNGIGRAEMRHILDHSHQSGAGHVVIMFHSFSAVKARDPQYSAMRPDRIVRRRFNALLDYLASNQDRFTVSTFGELAGQLTGLSTQETPLPRLGYSRPLLRNLVQAVNQWYWL